MLAVSGHENLVRMLVLSWPMVGDFLCGGPTPDWTSYELGMKEQDFFYSMMSDNLENQRNDPFIYPSKMPDWMVKKMP